MRLGLWSALLVLALGAVVLHGAVTAAESTGEAHRYTAVEVEYDGELVATDLRTGERRSLVDLEVDDRIVCLPSTTAECAMFHERFRSDDELPSGVGSRYRYAYLDDRFYRLERSPPSPLEFEAADASAALDDLALDWSDATEAEREAVADGHVVTSEPIRHEDRLLQRGDDYYTVVRSGYADGSFCTSGGGFCDGAAGSHLRWQWARPLALGTLGLAGVVVGAVGLFPHLPYRVRRRIVNVG